MRALAYFGKGNVRFTYSLKEPHIHAEDDVIIDISWCGICGTDLKEYTDGAIFFPEDGCVNHISNNNLPQAMGHEISGIISSVGPGCKKFKIGDHVVVEPTATCIDRYRWPNAPNRDTPMCEACRNGMPNICKYLGLTGAGVEGGGFAEKMVINEHHCHKIPHHMPLDVASLIQPISVCWHAVKVSHYKQGGSVLIVGGGPIGLGTILALKGFGCEDIVVSEPALIRRELAEKMGARVFDPSNMSLDNSIKTLTEMAPGSQGFDYTFDCSGIPATLKVAIECCTFRGTAVNIAVWGHKPVEFFPMDITSQEKRYTGSMCYTSEDFEEVIEAFKSKRIDINTARHLITGKVPIEEGIEGAMLRLLRDKGHTIKILLTPNNKNELGYKL
ncbi:hypothetical protein Kpol_1049p18 [Vanderwaltozyma polyspora DSM 70294]|uniref:Enoyl reductase (ER) domain-containing protein n=1 Tax=Vanderwaltozyma polyspora (strain ATCC 22028 / DSM 70294 / BCRC 21397 / CBS 2163 / NBRC 10782 / NRRL Y-8283 / UCD 57-17) TaxID=436907 RepID=A7TPQ8_VANPO|nr:uncharacterized protein Kpol_1049p18 [Vanderwaltozyma polyspora DSM 70294]EDO15760.1 hypothetical protein Kpol_1049p18 [Vanderwaltozyma polyspora DSM 70294]